MSFFSTLSQNFFLYLLSEIFHINRCDSKKKYFGFIFLVVLHQRCEIFSFEISTLQLDPIIKKFLNSSNLIDHPLISFCQEIHSRTEQTCTLSSWRFTDSSSPFLRYWEMNHSWLLVTHKEENNSNNMSHPTDSTGSISADLELTGNVHKCYLYFWYNCISL